MWNKIQRIYIGQNLVRPVAQELHYYIDFRTAGSLPSDWTATSGGTVDSNWLKASSVVWKQIDLSSANNLAITVTWNRTTTSWAGYDQLWMWDAPSAWTICYRLRADYRSNYTYQSEGTSLRYVTGGTETVVNTVTWKTPSGWNYTYTFNVDFNTWAWTASQYDSNSGYTNSPSYTLSASQIAELKTLTWFYLNIPNPNSITNYCYTVAIDIT